MPPLRGSLILRGSSRLAPTKSGSRWPFMTGKQGCTTRGLASFTASSRGHTGGLRCVRFSPDSKRVVTASTDKTARVYDVAKSQHLGTLEGHTDVVFAAAFPPDGSRIATCSRDKTVRVWDSLTFEQLAITTDLHNNIIMSVDYSPTGNFLLTASMTTRPRCSTPQRCRFAPRSRAIPTRILRRVERRRAVDCDGQRRPHGQDLERADVRASRHPRKRRASKSRKLGPVCAQRQIHRDCMPRRKRPGL